VRHVRPVSIEPACSTLTYCRLKLHPIERRRRFDVHVRYLHWDCSQMSPSGTCRNPTREGHVSNALLIQTLRWVCVYRRGVYTSHGSHGSLHTEGAPAVYTTVIFPTLHVYSRVADSCTNRVVRLLAGALS
jgi:hypothetical protein